MNPNLQETSILSAFFELAQEDEAATTLRLVARTGLSREVVCAGLERLEQGGFVDRERLRLTLPGLAFAVASAPRIRRTLAA